MLTGWKEIEKEMGEEEFRSLLKDIGGGYNVKAGTVWDEPGAEEVVEYGSEELMSRFEDFIEVVEEPSWEVHLYEEGGEAFVEAYSADYLLDDLALEPGSPRSVERSDEPDLRYGRHIALTVYGEELDPDVSLDDLQG